jgi:putative FmdB family regulatory protein
MRDSEVEALPLYEYECLECGRFERVQKFSDPILATCPTCEGSVKKLLSAPAIQFKGTGWYVTDYSGKSSGGKDRDAKATESKTSDAKDKSNKTAGSDKAKTPAQSGGAAKPASGGKSSASG